MNTLVTADLHLSDNPRDSYRFAFMRSLPALIKKYAVQTLIVSGDLTEDKDSHSATLVNIIVGHFYELSQLCEVVIQQGNHDWKTSADNAYFRFLQRFENITWIDKPTKWKPLDAIILPHSHNPAKEWANIDFDKYELAFAHQAFIGAEGDNGFRLEGGTPLSIFPSSLQVIAGDIHKPQEFENLIYCGSPVLVDFGNNYEPRVLLIDNKRHIKSIPVVGPQKRLIEVGSVKELESLPGNALNKGDILKVRIRITKKQHADWPQLVSAVKTWGALNSYLIYQVVPQLAESGESMIKQRRAAPKKSDQELLKDYSTHRAVDEATAKVGLGLI